VAAGSSHRRAPLGRAAETVLSSFGEPRTMIFSRRILTVAAAGVLTCAATATPAAAAPWPFSLIPSLYGVNVHSGKCLVAAGDGDPVAQRRCDPEPAYRWRFVPVTLLGLFHLENEQSGRCLTIAAGGRDDGDPVVQAPCDGRLSRSWRLRDAPGAGIYVENVNSGKCLTIAAGSVGEDARAVQYRCDGAVSRRWSFRATPNGPGVVRVNGGRP